MPSLSRDNRKLLENTVVAARSIAERGAEKSLISVGVGQRDAPDSLTQQERILRNQLRAHGRQLGDSRQPTGVQETYHLTQAVAYEHWHRMLFARFLAENDLLMHPDYGIAVSMDEVREAAREQGVDWLTLAMDCAQHMLIEVFRADDPVLRAVLPPETRLELEQRLEQLPVEVFTAEDSLGWVYQFWQSDEKERVNQSEVKIGADELAPVTQVFTEDYMVLFLLHNTLGAWWTAKRRAEGNGNELRDYEWTYLRLNDDGSPVAGAFDGWPRQLSELRVLDPCMGSGHFLAFALPILAKMAEMEYALTPGEAVHSVLAKNLYGLELDARCSQIAAFNLALTAWRYVGRYMPLPSMNLACSGLGINAPKESWMALAGDNGLLKDTLSEIYYTLQRAPILGSLIDPTRVSRPLLLAKFDQVWPLLEQALTMEQPTDDRRELAIAAKGLLAAVRVLAGHFTLVATNVPYLGRGKQIEDLKSHCLEFHPDAKADLATCFVDRCLQFCGAEGATALVTPQNWLFQDSYKSLRRRLLSSTDWRVVVRLGSNAFRDMNFWAATTALVVLSRSLPQDGSNFAGFEVGDTKQQEVKAQRLANDNFVFVSQKAQLSNPDCKIIFESSQSGGILSGVAFSTQGIKSGDDERFRRQFFELPSIGPPWIPLQTTVRESVLYGGLSEVIDWTDDGGLLARRQGLQAWAKRGVMVSHMRHMPVALYMGGAFDSNASPIVPRDERDLVAVWTYCQSSEYAAEVKKIDQAPKPTNSSLVQVPFDRDRWLTEAASKYPLGLPDVYSNDPGQMFFNGNPRGSATPLHVAVARMMGYRWPRQTGSSLSACPIIASDGLEEHEDKEGIVCLVPVGGGEPAAQRLRRLLQHAFDTEWSANKLTEFLGGAITLEEWLRDRFFEEHCGVFQDRPFIWHVWDGRKDGFHALINYHRLAGPNGAGKRTLEKLIYSSLGDWIGRQRADVASKADGAEGRLSAALHLQSELKSILIGEPPYDIFVRWKPLSKQAIGWEPNLNDGVRLNMRPWLVARPYQYSRGETCILRISPISLPLGKDRGKESVLLGNVVEFPWFANSQDRANDVHLTLDEKRKALG